MSEQRREREPRPSRGDPRAALRWVIQNAVELASERGSDTVEAEHLLLSLAMTKKNPVAAEALVEVGFDFDALDAALADERERSLAAVGVGPLRPDLLTATRRGAKAGWGTSAKEAFRRGFATAGGRGRRTTTAELDLLAGILLANVGTVPRIFAYAQIDRDGLIGRVQRARLADTSR